MVKLVGILLLISMLIYLNRAYAYFFNNLDNHKIVATNLKELNQFHSASQTAKLTYVALGDSLTYGTGVDDVNQTYPFLVANQFATLGKQNVDEYNLGIPGVRTAEVIKYELVKVNNLKPQLITLLVGLNDALSIETESNFQKNYQQILDQISINPNTKVIILNIPPLTNPKVMLPPYKYLVDLRIKRFNSIIDSLVTEKKKIFPNLVFINLYDQTRQQFIDDSSLYSADYFHPSAKGYKLWSQILTNDSNL